MKKKRIFRLSIIILAIIMTIYLISKNNVPSRLELNEPIRDLIPDEVTAIRIAEAIGMNTFSKELKNYKPFHASLKNDSIWHVYGLPKKSWFYVQMGGGPVFEIQKVDGKILKVYISK
jgi:hypothetical protein